MKMISLFLVFCLINNVNSHPFNSSECVTCINKINYIHKYNNTYVDLINNITNFCKKYNLGFCKNTTYYLEYFNKNPEDICEYLGYCEKLDINNYIFSFKDSLIKMYDIFDYNYAYKNYENLYLYQYYDTIICMNITSTNDALNFSKVWQINMDEQYQKINYSGKKYGNGNIK